MPDHGRPRRTGSDYRFWATAWAMLVFFRLALWSAPYRVVARLLPAGAETPAPAWARKRVRWAVGTAARRAPHATCLPQALTAHVLLALQGFHSTIRIGARRDETGAVKAHAWVVSAGDVVIGDEDASLDAFSPLTTLRGAK